MNDRETVNPSCVFFSMLFQMEILNLVFFIIFVVYSKYANDVLKHVTCFIIIMLVSLVALQYDQLNRISNEFQSFKILMEKQQVTHAKELFRLTQKVQSDKAFTKRNEYFQDGVNKGLISKIFQHEGKLNDMENTLGQVNENIQNLLNELLNIYKGVGEIDKKVDKVVDDLQEELSNRVQLLENEIKSESESLKAVGYKLERHKHEQNKELESLKQAHDDVRHTIESEVQSFKSFFEKKQQIQDGVNRRLNNKVLENEGKLTNTEKTFAQINKSIEILINESLHIYSGYSKMNEKVDIVVVELKTVNNSRAELASHVKFLEYEIKSVSEYLKPFGYKLERNKDEQNKENSNHYNPHHTTVVEHSSIPDLQGIVEEGIIRVISYVVSVVVNAVATIVSGIASWLGGFLW